MASNGIADASPTKRGLKQVSDIRGYLLRAVEEASPTKRGLKLEVNPVLVACDEAEGASPMKRGPKEMEIGYVLDVFFQSKEIPR